MELGERKVPGPGRALAAALAAAGEEEFDEGGVEYSGVPGATRVPFKGREEKEIMLEHD